MPESTRGLGKAGQGVSRRGFLAGSGAAALTLAPLVFAGNAEASGTVTQTITGHLAPGAADWVYLPIDVPAGVRELHVSYGYDKPVVATGALGNSCDIGIFDERGVELGSDGFRGWSGGFRTEFSIAADAATPGYLPGPVNRGRWHVVLGPYQVSARGLAYSVTVTLTFGRPAPPFRPDYPPQRVRGTGRRWYRGDCHLHTVYSDGKRLPGEVAAGARAAGLDFMVTTDHNTSASHGVWGALADDELLIVTGEEITTRNGHVLALGVQPGHWIDWRYRAVDDEFARFAREIRHDGGIVVPAHPYCPYVGCRWKFGYDDADAIEVWNGPWTIDDEAAVETWDAQLTAAAHSGGRWLPAMGNSDAHSEPQVIGLPHNVVLADSLAKGALMTAIAAGRSYVAESSGVAVALTAAASGRTAGIGERLRVGPDVSIDVTADVRGVPHGVVRFVTDEGQLHQSQLDESGSGRTTLRVTAQLAAYVRVEVRHPLADGSTGSGTAMGTVAQLGAMAALTNPIWLGRRT